MRLPETRLLAALLLATPLLASPLLTSPGHAAGERASRSGSGFLVGETYALTNSHVVNGCARVVVRNDRRQSANARVIAEDRQSDLALLAVPPGAGTPLVFRSGPPVERGEQVITYGFPLYGLLTSGPTLTTGDVSALSGIRDNKLHLQISAPVQPGNSGGPLLDNHGHVIGVVTSKLNALRIARITGGDLPQNINFAIKGTAAAEFLAAHKVAPRLATSTGPALSPAQVGERANTGTLFVECFGGAPREAAATPAPRPAPTAPAANGPKAADDPSFRLINHTREPIVQIFATPSGSLTWGRNRLQQRELAPDDSYMIRIPPGQGCTYDLRVVSSFGHARDRKYIDLCRVTDVPVS